MITDHRKQNPLCQSVRFLWNLALFYATILINLYLLIICLQCFDTVGWAAGRAYFSCDLWCWQRTRVDCHVTRLTVCPVHPHHLPRHLTPASAARRHSGLARTRLSCQVSSPTSHRPSTLSSMDRNVSCTVYYSVSQKKDAKLLPMKKVAHTRLPSIGFRSWSRLLAVSLQVMWVINLAVGNRYFSPGPQLPPQSLRGLLPVLLLGEQRHSGCEQFAQDSIATAICNLPIASRNINRFSNFLLLSLRWTFGEVREQFTILVFLTHGV